MQRLEDTSPISDERLERLISRHLDGELAPEDRIELDAALASRPEARALSDEYARNDLAAADALDHDFQCIAAPSRRPFDRRFRLATLAVSLAAAAAIALSVLPQWIGKGPGSNGIEDRGPLAQLAGPANSEARDEPVFVDYRDVDFTPQRRERTTWRNLIGIRDRENGVIYILETDLRSTRLSPVSGDF